MDDGDSTPGWYWLRHAVFRGKAGAWHELHPIIVELGQDGKVPMMMLVSGGCGAIPGGSCGRRMVGPLTAPQ